MDAFIEFTKNEDGKKVFVNIRQISFVEERTKDISIIVFDAENAFAIRHSYQDIKDAITEKILAVKN